MHGAKQRESALAATTPCNALKIHVKQDIRLEPLADASLGLQCCLVGRTEKGTSKSKTGRINPHRESQRGIVTRVRINCRNNCYEKPGS